MHNFPLFRHVGGVIPSPASPSDSTRWRDRLLAETAHDELLAAFVEDFLGNPTGNQLVCALFGNSPHLAQLLIKHLPFFRYLCECGIQHAWKGLLLSIETLPPQTQERDLMHTLRITKAQASLLIAIADIAGIWTLEQVTGALSDLADASLRRVCDFLLTRAAERGDLLLTHPQEPSRESGLIVLGMGKLGGRELNYSSDIDLILLYDRDKIRYQGKQTLQHCFNKLAQDLVRLMQERDQNGYVFRTDLRLRPDPASTPPAISIRGAMTYYETVGQNWERAALIKARPVAGDITAGDEFLKQIEPFIWRKHLDFAAIADIQSIKRQMNAHIGGKISLPGHHVKLGPGGIREIEFYAQIHQLIWGGRKPSLRGKSTCQMLVTLAAEGLIEQETSKHLIESYRFYRTVEHRLQMINDHQTHSLPTASEEMTKLAIFLGYESPEQFGKAMLSHLNFVHDVYANSFQGPKSLSAEGNLVFTGVELDPETLKTIGGMGYHHASTIAEVIQGWHHGRRRATRTKRARELITELTPALLKAFANSAHPDTAFLKFDEFLGRLPAGVQLFSLFQANPHLLDLIATIMGSAPALAEHLSKNPGLFDVVLTSGFHHDLPDRTRLHAHAREALVHTRNFEDGLEALRRFKNEKHFQAGIKLLNRDLSAEHAGHFLTQVAETVLEHLLELVNEEFARTYGNIEGSDFAVLAMGKLGARELTFGSDLDLVFLYDVPDMERHSDGPRGFTASVYYNRLAQRFIGALTALTQEGRLYEVDTRLRPSGKDGPMAVHIQAFDKYFTESAWVFEFMALTKARTVAGPSRLCSAVETIVNQHLSRPRSLAVIAPDVHSMREKIDKEFRTDNPWNIKYARGGMIDLDFIAQTLLLAHAARHPTILRQSTQAILTAARDEKVISPEVAESLLEAAHFFSSLLMILRLCNDGSLNDHIAPPGLMRYLAASFGVEDLEQVKARLVKTEQEVRRHFETLIGGGA